MKKLLFVISLFFAFSFTNAQWQWENPKPKGTHIECLYAFSADSLIVFTKDGGVLTTSDGGLTFNERDLSVFTDVRNYIETSPSHSYILGKKGLLKSYIARSEDNLNTLTDIQSIFDTV